MIHRISPGISYLLVIVYSAISVYAFQVYGIPSLSGEISQQLYSDSVTYENAYLFGLETDLITVGGNYFGPILVLELFGGNRSLINLFNLFVLIFSLFAAFKLLSINRGVLLLLLFSSPLLFFSTFGVNKEIFIFPFCVFMLVYLERRAAIWLVTALMFGILVRWQIIFFCFLMLFIVSKYNPFREKRSYTLIALLGFISFAYPLLISELFEAIEQISTEGAIDEGGTGASGIYFVMQEVQRSFGYFLVVVPKTFHLFIGLIFRFDFESIQADFWNNFVIMFQSFHNFILLFLALYCKKLKISEGGFYLICIFAIMFALTPIFAPRYLFPISLWLAISLSLRRVT